MTLQHKNLYFRRLKEHKTMKKNTIAYNFAKYLYDNKQNVFEWTFQDAKDYYYNKITKKQYEVATEFIKNLAINYYDGYIQLSDNHTFWRLHTNKSDSEIIYILENKYHKFEQLAGIEVFALGRSGRHICIEDTFENVMNYEKLKDLQTRLEDEFVSEVNEEQGK